MKRRIALLLVICMLTTMLPPALAEEIVQIPNSADATLELPGDADGIVEDGLPVLDLGDVDSLQLDLGDLEQTDIEPENIPGEEGESGEADARDGGADNATAAGVPKTLTLGQKQTYAIDASKVSGGKTVTYKSSKATVATVSKKGVITAKKNGTAKITLTVGKKTVATCTVTVVNAPGNVTLPVSSITLDVKATYQIKPKLPNKTMASFTYSSADKKIAKVSKEGLVTGLKVGSTTITVKTHNNKTAELSVTVKATEPTEAGKVTLSQTKATLSMGDTLQLTATLPKGTASVLTWTSDKPAVAKVNDYGLVTAEGAGTAKITVATANGKKASCTVTVNKAPGKVTIKPTAVTLAPGESIQLKATLPKGTTSELTWKSAKSAVAKVNENGLVTAVKAGTAKITVETNNGKKDTCVVTVKKNGGDDDAKAPKKVTLDQTKATLSAGDTLQLVAALPAGTVSSLTWTSDNTKVAKVNKNGLVTAVDAGTAKITVATANGKKATCALTVKKAPESVTLNAHELILGVDETFLLRTTLLPKGATSDLTWKSNKASVVKVNEDGMITAVKAGTAKITVETYNGKKDTCKVTVEKAALLRAYTDQASFSILPTNNAKLQVKTEVKRDPELTYKWYLGKTEITGATGTDYTVTADKVGSYAYKCVVSDGTNSQDVAFTVTVDNGLTAKASSAAEQTIYTKQETTLSVTAECSVGKPTYQWYEGDTVIDGATSASYAATKADAGDYTYKCVVSDGYGSTAEVGFTVTVKARTLTDATAQTASFSLKPGDKATLKVNVTTDGEPGLTYKWYLGENEITGANAASYAVTAGNVGSYAYKCVVTDDSAKKNSKTVSFTVSVANGLSAKASSATEQTVYMGKAATLSVTASASTNDKLSYQWYEGDTAISGATKASYAATKAAAGSYAYKCVVSDGYGSTVEVDFTVTVKEPTLTGATADKAAFTVAPKGTATLKVNTTTDGEPTLTYKWFEGTTEISGATGASYAVTAGNAGKYTYKCQVSDGTNTKEVTFTVTVDNGFTAKASSATEQTQTVFTGKAATLSVTASATTNDKLSYQWYEGNTEISGETAASYSATKNAAGNYTYKCVVSDGYGSTAEVGFTVTVKEPTLTGATADKAAVTVAPKGTATLKVNVTTDGEPTLTYKWFEGTTEIIGATGASYAVTAGNVGEYTYKCQVSDGTNSKEVSFTVTVDNGFTARASSATEQTAFTGKAATLSVTASATTNDKLSYQWYEGDTAISGATSASYAATKASAGSTAYKCVVSDGYGSEAVTLSFTVTVKEPKLTGATADKEAVTVAPKGTATLKVNVTVDGEPALSYKWYLGETAIEGATGAEYTVTAGNVGSYAYKCVVSDDSTTQNSATVDFTVTVNNGFAAEATSATEQTVFTGKAAALSVTASATVDDTLSYQWYEGDAAITGATADSYAATKADAGNYTYKCVVSDGYGSTAEVGFTVTVKEPKLTGATADKEAVTVAPKGTATLKVNTTVEGEPGLSYQWYEGESTQPIAGADTDSYDVTAGDVGEYAYRCVVTDDSTTQNSKTVDFTVTVANAFAAQADGETTLNIYTGATATMSVTASATVADKISYQWYAEDAKIEGATAASYTTEAIAAAGEYAYRCVVGDGYGSEAVTVNFTVTAKAPSLTEATAETARFALKPTEQATLKVVTECDGEPTLSYTWFAGETKIDGETTDSYAVTAGNVGEYTYKCQVSDGTNTKEVTFTVTVDNGFSAKAKGEAAKTVIVNGTATLEVEAACATGDKLSYKWTRTDAPETVLGTEAAYTTDAFDTVGVYGYTCEIDDGYGSAAATLSFTVNVVNVPELTSATAVRDAFTVAPTGSATLEVQTECAGAPTLTYAWYAGEATDPIDGANEASYAVTAGNVGEYTYKCQVSDGTNTKEVTFTVTVDNGLTASASGEAELTVTIDEAAELAVEAGCTKGEPTYRWFEGESSEPIEGAESASYSVTKSEAGTYTYRCEVGDAYGSAAQSVAFTVTVTEPDLVVTAEVEDGYFRHAENGRDYVWTNKDGNRHSLRFRTEAESDFTVTVSDDWMQTSEDGNTFGAYTGYVWVYIDKNLTGAVRTGTVTFASESTTVTYTVSQLPYLIAGLTKPAAMVGKVTLPGEDSSVATLPFEGIDLAWNAVDGATRYEIGIITPNNLMRDSDGDRPFISYTAETAGSSFTAQVAKSMLEPGGKGNHRVFLWIYDAYGHRYANYYDFTVENEANPDWKYIYQREGDAITGVYIQGYKGDATELVIPATIDGYPVVAIDEWAFDENDSITGVTIPNGVTTIWNGAFWGCAALRSIVVPDSIETIRDNAFDGCNALKDIQVTEGTYAWNWFNDHGFFESEGILESDHPYESNSNETWTYTHPEAAEALEVTFSAKTELEDECDYLYISDANGDEKRYTGSELSGRTIAVMGNSFTIRLKSDGSVEEYGFKILSVTPATGLIKAWSDQTDFAVEPLSDVTMQVQVTYIGDGVPTYAWYDGDDNRIEGAEGPEYTIESATRAGEYRCEVSDSYGRNKTVWFWVEIDNQLALSAVDGRTNISVVAGNSVTLGVTASCLYGKNDLQYQWEQGVRTLVEDEEDEEEWYETKWQPIANANGSEYTIAAVTEKGQYRCTVTDSFGNSRTVSFTVNAIDANNITVLTLNQPATATIENSGDIARFSFVPEETGEYEFYSTGSQDTYGYLYDADWNEISRNDDADNSNFKIRYTLTEGTQYYFGAREYNNKACAFEVRLRMYFDNQLTATAATDASFNVLAGRSVTLGVSATCVMGQENLTYRWEKTVRVHDEEEDNYYTRWQTIDDANAPEYVIDAVSESARYRCTVEDEFGNSAQAEFTVNVIDPNSARALVLGEPQTVSIEGYDGNYALFSFVPETSGWYAFIGDEAYVDGMGKYGTLLDADLKQISTADQNTSYRLMCNLTAGARYYFMAGYTQGYGDGSYDVVLERDSSLDDIQTLTLGEETTVNITEAGQTVYYRFTPEKTGYYDFSSMDHWDYWGYLYDGNMTELDKDSKGGGSGRTGNFRIVWKLIAGNNYYFATRYDNKEETGSYRVMLTEGHGLLSVETEQSFFTVASKTQITLQVQAQSIEEDELTYTWFKNFATDGEEELTDVHSASYTLSAEETADYTCIVNDGYDHELSIYFAVHIESDLAANALGQTELSASMGDTVELAVTASCSTCEPSYQWYEAWERIEGANSAAYTTKPIRRVETAVYCHVSDDYGNTRDVWFYIDCDNYVDNNLQAWAVSDYISVTPEETATLEASVSAKDLSGATAQWFYRLRTLNDQGDWEYGEWATLGESEAFTAEGTEATVTRALSDGELHTTNYRCVITDKYGNEADAEFYVSVDSGMSVEWDWEKTVTRAPYGEAATLAVQDPGEGVSLTWYNYTDETDYVRIEGETGTSLTVSDVTGRKRYGFVAADRYWNSCTNALDVTVENHLTAEAVGDSDVSVAPNGRATLAVNASSDDNSHSYRWSKEVFYENDGGGSGWERVYFDDANEATLTTDEITANGWYYCEVSDSYGTSVEVEFYVRVNNELSMQARNGNTTIMAPSGDDVTLAVEVTAVNTEGLTLTWQKYVEDEGYTEIEGEAGYELTLKGVTESARYRCTVEDEFGNKSQVEFTVKVVDPTSTRALVLGEPQTVSIEGYNGDYELFSFVPETSGWYAFIGDEAHSDWNVKFGTLLDGELNQITTADQDTSFRLMCELTAGIRYYFMAGYTPGYGDKSYEVVLKRDETLDGIQALTPGDNATANITEGGQIAYFSYTPEETGYYAFSSSAESDTYGYLYDDRLQEIAKDDDSGEGSNFKVMQQLTAGATYYFGARYYDSGDTGSFDVLLERVQGLISASTEQSQFTVAPETEVTMQVKTVCTEGETVSYQWFLDGESGPESIDGETQPAYTVTVTRAAQYRCEVSDTHGNMKTVQFWINVDNGLQARRVTPAVEDEEDDTIHANMGEAVALAVEASCNDGAPRYQWYEAGERIEGANSAAYTTKPIRRERTEVYCHVSDDYGNTRDVWFYIDCDNYVENDLQAYAVSDYISVTPEETATLEASVSANDLTDATARWFYRPRTLNDHGEWDEGEWEALGEAETVEADGGEATLSRTLGEGELHSTNYRCEVSDKYGNTAAAEFSVAVDTGLSMTWDWENTQRSVPYGESATITTMMRDGNWEPVSVDGLSYTWYERNGDANERIGGQEGNRYTIPSVTRCIEYECVAVDVYWNQYNSSDFVGVENNLDVEIPQSNAAYLWLWSTKALVPVISGNSVTLVVDASCDTNQMTYQWISEGDGVISGADQSSIEITPTTGNKVYYCTVTDNYGNAKAVYFDVSAVDPQAIQAITAGTPVTVSFSEYYSSLIFSFTPETSGNYAFESSEIPEHYFAKGCLYDADFNAVCDNTGEYPDFRFEAALNAGETYYLAVGDPGYMITYNVQVNPS